MAKSTYGKYSEMQKRRSKSAGSAQMQDLDDAKSVAYKGVQRFAGDLLGFAE